MATAIIGQQLFPTIPPEPKAQSGGLFNRFKNVGASLRNMSRQDVAFAGLSIGAGLAAKASVLALLGVASGGTTLVAALAGGAAVGLAKSAVKQLREGKSARPFFSRQTLMSTVSSAALAGATLGCSELFEHLTGDTITHTLTSAFHKAADHVTDKFINVISGTQAFATARDQVLSEEFDYSNRLTPNVTSPQGRVTFGTSLAPAGISKDVVPGSHSPTGHSSASEAKKLLADAAREKMLEAKSANEFALKHLRDLILKTTGIPAAADATAEDLAKQFHPKNSNAFLEGIKQQAPRPVPQALVTKALEHNSLNAARMTPSLSPSTTQMTANIPVDGVSDKVVNIADLPKMNFNSVDPKSIIIRAGNGVEIRMPAAPDVHKEFEIAQKIIRQSAEGDVPVNLDPKKMAAVCVTDLPSTEADFEKQEGLLPNACSTVAGKEDMNAGDYVIVRDVAEDKPSPKKGLRFLTSKFAQNTSAFIARAVGDNALPEMSAEKLAVTHAAP